MGQTQLKNRVSIVTGGSSGIGKATALTLAENGSCVVLASRNLKALEENAREITDRGGRAWALPVDVTKRDDVEGMVDKVLEKWGRIDVLVSNAGQYIRSPIADMSFELLERSMSVNFYSHVYAVLAVLPHMLEKKSGNIVFVSTMDAKKGLPPDAPYVSGKFAMTGFAEVLRQEVISKGIFVTTVFPGRIDTPLIEDLDVPWISAKMPAEAVSKAILRGIRQRKAEVFLPPQVRLLYLLNVISPGAADWVVKSFKLGGWETKKN
jgi:uncharacterized protein